MPVCSVLAAVPSCDEPRMRVSRNSSLTTAATNLAQLQGPSSSPASLLALTSLTTPAGHTGTPPKWGLGFKTSSSEHSGLLMSGSQAEELGLSRHRTCFVKSASGDTIFLSWLKPAHKHSAP